MRGFFCHLAMTYPLIFAYLKGFHLTLSSHLPRRNEEGWKLTDLEFCAYLEEMRLKGKVSQDDISEKLGGDQVRGAKPPVEVTPVPRFFPV